MRSGRFWVCVCLHVFSQVFFFLSLVDFAMLGKATISLNTSFLSEKQWDVVRVERNTVCTDRLVFGCK